MGRGQLGTLALDREDVPVHLSETRPGVKVLPMVVGRPSDLADFALKEGPPFTSAHFPRAGASSTPGRRLRASRVSCVHIGKV